MNESTIEMPMSIAEAEAQIAESRQEMAQMGGNDYELPETEHILDHLRNGEMAPEEAVRQVREIQSGKQNYH